MLKGGPPDGLSRGQKLVRFGLLTGIFIIYLAGITWALAQATESVDAGVFAFVVTAIFVPVIAYGRYFVNREDQGAFKRAINKVLMAIVIVVVTASLVVLVYLLGSNN